MKKLILALLLTFSVSGGAAWAQTHYELAFGLNVTRFDYKEELNPPLKSAEKGIFFIPFVKGKAFLPQLNSSFLNAELERSTTVESEYDGSTLTGVPVKEKNFHVFTRAEIDFYAQLASGFYLYLGYGYRSWDRFLSGGSGYREFYQWNYMPVGVLVEFPLGPVVEAGVDVAYLPMSNGKIDIIFSETVVNGDDTELTLGNKPGWRVRVPLKIKRDEKYSLQVTPWYEFSEIGASEWEFNSTPGLNTIIQEPASKTQQYGAYLGISLHF